MSVTLELIFVVLMLTVKILRDPISAIVNMDGMGMVSFAMVGIILLLIILLTSSIQVFQEKGIPHFSPICDHPPRLSPFVGKLSFMLQVKISYNSLWLTMVLDKL